MLEFFKNVQGSTGVMYNNHSRKIDSPSRYYVYSLHFPRKGLILTLCMILR